MRLLLESTLVLDGQFGSHLVGWAWAEDVLLSWIGMVFKVPIQIRSPRNILLTLMWRSRENCVHAPHRRHIPVLAGRTSHPATLRGLQQLRRGKNLERFIYSRGVWPMKPR